MRFFIVLFALCIIASVFPGQALAHTENSVGYSKVTIKENKVRYQLYIDYFELGRVVALEVKPGAAQDQLSEALVNNQKKLERYVNDHLDLYVDGLQTEGKITQTSVMKLNGEREYAKIVLNYAVSDVDSSSLLIKYNVFFEDNDPMHRNIMTYEWGKENGQFVFTAEDKTFKSGGLNIWGQISRFVQQGFHHILIGYDHILFVLALILGARKSADVLKVATVFTLAHSVTLGLTALDLVSIPAAIVEPLIALSIAYVAVENILLPNSKVRYPVVFFFGLIHGIGFAGALQLIGGVTWKSLLSILSFNIGVELGQALIIILLFPLLVYIRKYRWSIVVHGTATAGIFFFGLFWYFQRFLG